MLMLAFRDATECYRSCEEIVNNDEDQRRPGIGSINRRGGGRENLSGPRERQARYIIRVKQ